MKSPRRLLLVAAVLAASCGPKADRDLEIRQAVAETLAAMPSASPAPQPPPPPAPTALKLSGLFCEYEFCVGHPAGAAFYDLNAVTSNQAVPSNYQSGFLAAYNTTNLVIQLLWQFAPDASDPQFLLDLIVDEKLDTRGNMDVRLIGDLNVLYMPITDATPIVPHGAAAAWVCGDRVFAWKVYTADAPSAEAQFSEALGRFVCE